MNQYKVAFISLGCAKNLVNTEQMAALVRQAGHTVVAAPEGADVCVLNTCGFIDSAKSEAIDNILYLGGLKQAGQLKKLLVAGCLSQRYRNDIKKELPEVDGMLGTGSYTDVVSAIDAVMDGNEPECFGDISHTYEDGDRMVSTVPWTAYLKIAEGCDNYCAFCIIPYLRGHYRSRSMESLLKEAKKLADSGVKELIIIAQDITRYGIDLYHKPMLAELLRQLCQMDFHWIRLHYLYPDLITDELIDVIAENDKILNYLDIPIQHCNDNILRAMCRRGTKEQISALFQKLRERLPGLVLRTSLICGLPGEGDSEFEELCDFLEKAKIERAGVFQYSPEEGTKAVEMPNQVDADIAAHRVELIVDLQSRIMDEMNSNRLGQVLEVLCEGFDSEIECFVGRSYADSVDIDGKVYFTAAGHIEPGTFVNVKITDLIDGDLMGEIEEEIET